MHMYIYVMVCRQQKQQLGAAHGLERWSSLPAQPPGSAPKCGGRQVSDVVLPLQTRAASESTAW